MRRLYIVSSIKSILPAAGDAAHSLLQLPQIQSLEAVLINLINDIAAQNEKIIFVIDDYHYINSPQSQHIIKYLIDHLPQQLHLIIITRSDPAIPLARLRGQGQLIEIRASDLSFNFDESLQFFNTTQKLFLSTEDISVLGSRTEGWITGLQLAALSLKNCKNISAFIKNFQGDNQYIADYLFEEVLSQQSEAVKAFLLQTSILDSLSVPLCNAVLNRTDSLQIINFIENENLFIVAIDDAKSWFRYHRLFADLLNQRLMNINSFDVNELHQRALIWYQQNGFNDEAIEHAFAIRNFQAAAHIIERHAESLWLMGQQLKLFTWFQLLPDKYIVASPLLCIFQARELFMNGFREQAEDRLNNAERLITENSLKKFETTSGNILDKDQLQGRIAVVRSIIASYRGKVELIVTEAEKALKYLGAHDYIWRAVAALTLGLSHGWSGDGQLEKSQRAFLQAREASEAANNLYLILFTGICLTGVEIAKGGLNSAYQKLTELLKFAEDHNLANTGVAGSINASLGTILCEQNEFEKGFAYLNKGLELAEKAHDFIMLTSSRLNYSRVLIYQQRYKEAQDVVSVIESISKEHNIPPWMEHSKEAIKAYIWLMQGKTNKVEQWAKDRKLSIDDPFSQRRENEHFTLAKLLVEQHKYQEAEKFINRFIEYAKSVSHILVLMELHGLKSQLFHSQQQQDKAMTELKLALRIAEQSGSFYTFINAGQVMKEMLELFTMNKTPDTEKRLIDYAKKILAAFKSNLIDKKKLPAENELSDREIEVLQHIEAGLTNQEISEALFISLNTVKSHIKNINSKLDVHSRIQALAKAKEMQLI